jgi:polyisoprenoid-binding protein YceI
MKPSTPTAVRASSPDPGSPVTAASAPVSPGRPPRPWWRRPITYLVVVPVVVVVLAVVVAPYVYIHLVEGPPPEKLTLGPARPPAATGATSGRPARADGVWRLTSGSRAGYRVQETLFGQSTTAVGRTDEVRGQFAVGGTSVLSGRFTVDLRRVTSDREQRDQQFRTRIMDTNHFPNATFELSTPIELARVPAKLATIATSARGRLTLHGVAQTVRVRLVARRNASRIEINGSIPVAFADYGIPNPSLGPASTEDHGEIEFLLVSEREQ